MRQAHAVQEPGCFPVVLECVPAELSARITAELTIPAIGVGAGSCTDGQILVPHDRWGMNRVPRFVRRYLAGEQLLTGALNRYDTNVKECRCPSKQESCT